MKEADLVNHPPHYTKGKFEVIEVIEDWNLDFNLGNAIKYIARADHKGNAWQDLKKAVWYVNRRIEQIENEAKIDKRQLSLLPASE